MTTLLRNILPFDLLKQMLDEGYIRSQVHPQYKELVILNYSESAQFDRAWNAATIACRGLIVVCGPNGLDADAVVLARPFGKFHNLNTDGQPETMEANLPTDTPLVTEKLDGSLGILYQWDSQWWVATRGSFDSDQARWATAWFRQNVGKWIMAESDATAVFEIVYQQNRIVIDYDWEGMVLLGVIDNYFGRELPRESVEWIAGDNHVGVVKKFDKTLAECASENNVNEEGYVLTYSNGVKIKCKFPEYVRLHRVLTGLNPRAIWELLSQDSGAAVDAILNDPKMPAVFLAWFRGWVEQLRGKYAALERDALRAFARRPKFKETKDAHDLVDVSPALRRKAAAMYFKQTPHLMSVLFAMLDGKDYAGIIWGKIEPRGDATFKKDGK